MRIKIKFDKKSFRSACILHAANVVRNKKIMFTLLAIIILTALIIHHHKKYEKNARPIAMATIPVRVSHPLQQSLPTTVSAPGYLIAKKSTIITPRASGYIKGIYFHEGNAVKTGDVLFQLDQQTQKNALAAAKATAELSQLEYERDKKFLAKGYVTQDLVYSAQVTYKQNQAALKTAQTNLAQRRITAPFNGAAGALSVSLGDYVNPGNTLTTLVDNTHLRVAYTLPVKDLTQIQLNQPVSIADPNNKSHTNAAVSYVAPAVNQSTQTIAVHAQVDNTAHLFKPGEYVTVTQILGSQKNALLIPEQTLQAAVDGYSVFIVKNNKAVSVPVKIGKRIGGNVVITNGLKSTDQVIVEGENEVKNGQMVSIQT